LTDITPVSIPNADFVSGTTIKSAEVDANNAAIKTTLDDLTTAWNELNDASPSPAAGITDGNLASPNNSVYRTLLTGGGALLDTAGGGQLAAGTYFLLHSGMALSPYSPSSLAGGVGFYFDDADYTVGGLTQKLRIRAQVCQNATASTNTFTFGLYPVTFSGASEVITATSGTVVSNSTVAAANASASTPNSYVGTDFTIPADGFYALGVVWTGNMTQFAGAIMEAQLQTRNV
jgi:hypothetical protein